MNVDELLWQTLQQRAEAIEPSPGGWTAVAGRIQRRQRRTQTMRMSMVVGMSFAAVALAVTIVTVTPETPDQNVAATGGADPAYRTSTTLAATAAPGEPGAGSTPTTAAPSVPGQDPARPGAEPGSPGATIAARPNQTSPGMTSTGFPTGTIWPETAAELETLQAQVADGAQLWRLDQEQVAARYLADRGLPTSGAGTPRSIGEPGVLRYTSGGVGGWVFMGELNLGDPDSNGVRYVSGSRTDRIVRLYVARPVGSDRLAVDVTATAPGKVVVRTKRPGSDWNAGTTRTVAAEESVALDVEGPAGTDLIVQVRHEGTDGEVGISDELFGAVQGSLGYTGLDTGSILEAAQLGQVFVGMTLAEAERFAGIEMDRDGGTNACTRLSPTGRPEGVELIASVGSDKVDVIIVSARGVQTGRGIRVGDSADDVRAEYPGIEDRVTDGSGRLVHTPDNDATPGYEMFFEIVDGEVVAIWSGRTGVSNTDELCA